jgi:hypothetical protein
VAAGRWSLVAGTLTVPGPTGVNSAGPHRLDEWLFIDADSTIARAYGPAKQGVSFGYTKEPRLPPVDRHRAGTGQHP